MRSEPGIVKVSLKPYHLFCERKADHVPRGTAFYGR